MGTRQRETRTHRAYITARHKLSCCAWLPEWFSIYACTCSSLPSYPAVPGHADQVARVVIGTVLRWEGDLKPEEVNISTCKRRWLDAMQLHGDSTAHMHRAGTR